MNREEFGGIMMTTQICEKTMPTLIKRILDAPAKRVVLSGPSGFVGSRVLDVLLQAHELRKAHGLDPGEVILLSSSPGNMMKRISLRYPGRMKTLRASRVDYHTQHGVVTWRDHLGSLGVTGKDSVFMNLAGLTTPISGDKRTMTAVNYKAVVAAVTACEELDVGHFIQSSTQATNSERAGQVPYSRGKAMADFHLSRLKKMPVTIAVMGLLYCKTSRSVGQDHRDRSLNLIDLSVLPFTPIMGSGRAPLQPQEVSDAALRLAYLALTNPQDRPLHEVHSQKYLQQLQRLPNILVYDAVGPQTMSMVDMLRRFAHFQGNHNFRPVYIDYRNMESILNVMSLGNLNRQFVSLLRSEQDDLKKMPFIGDPQPWDELLGEDHAVRLTRISDACKPTKARRFPFTQFPFVNTFKLLLQYPKAILPGLRLSNEIIYGALGQGGLYRRRALSTLQQEALFLKRFGGDANITANKVREAREDFERFEMCRNGELDEYSAMLLIQLKRNDGGAKSFIQMREMFDEMDINRNGNLSFIEYACRVFEKDLEKWELRDMM